MRPKKSLTSRIFMICAAIVLALSVQALVTAREPNARVVQVTAGQVHSQVVCSQETVLSAGSNFAGQLGDGTFVDSDVPVKVNLRGGHTVAAKSGHVLAARSRGEVLGWGTNVVGQLGNGIWSFHETTPVEAVGIEDAVAVAVGHDHSMILTADGTVWSMGLNWIGQLGVPVSVTYVPQQVPYLDDVVAIAAGWYHSMAITSDGSLWAWGANISGQLGIGTTSWGEWEPVRVSGLENVVAVRADSGHTVALTADGTVWAWGSNGSGQLGDGTTENRYSPVRVEGLSGGVAIAAGANHSVAVLDDGTVWSWGRNHLGQLGDGTFNLSLVPVQVAGLKRVTNVAAGAWHNLALDQMGNVWGWGDNRYGALGTGAAESTNVPVETLFREACKEDG